MTTFHFITEFSESIEQYVVKGIFKRAFDEGIFNLNFVSLRSFSVGKHKKIDGYPFSNKMGMLLRADVIYSAITSIPNYESMKIIYPSPKGCVLTQSMSKNLALDCKKQDIIFLSGYYQGIDERILKVLPIETVSIGDYVLNSGDTASLVIAETIIRQLPGVLGNADCIENDTHVNPWFQSPCYTQPVIFKEQEVPPILRSGNHQAIENYKCKESIKQTLFNRLDICGSHTFSNIDIQVVTELLEEASL